MTSKKQITANKKNSKKAGVKTAKGKAISKFNALKHGLLAKEIIIDAGDGKENRNEFDSLMDGLIDHFKPMGTIEEILVEKIAVSYWRQRRAKRYEIGIIRNTLDTFTDELNTNELKQDIEWKKNEVKGLNLLLYKLYKDFEKENHPPLSDYYGDEWGLGWHELALFYDSQDEKLNKNWLGMTNQEIHELIIDSGFEPDFNYFYDLFTDYIETRINKLDTLKIALRDLEMRIERMPLINGVLQEDELNKLLRYETAIEKQFYKALTELERIQRTKGGEVMPPPISLEITNN